ncbi:MAG: homoserine kinase [Endozoicomonadaceae bacterium]|nr:homoserine kinase [Endozoicomonadaceae bacterium]
MSVYTRLEQQDIETFLTNYDQGVLVDFRGIEAGIENSNYFVNTQFSEEPDIRQFVLTLFEYQPREHLPFFIDFMTLLADNGLPSPVPVRNRQGKILLTLKGKPCLLQPRMPGVHLDSQEITASTCFTIGRYLAIIHQIGQSALISQENLRGIPWIKAQVNRLTPLLSEAMRDILTKQWQAISKELKPFEQLPKGLIHADLFFDNVLFNNGKVSGIIDFFQSCHDWLIYDISVAVNDWCLNDDLTLNSKKTEAFLNGYQSVRVITLEEKQAWPVIQRLSCFRFWLSRLVMFVHPENHHDSYKNNKVVRNFLDPEKFRTMLILRTQKAHPIL